MPPKRKSASEIKSAPKKQAKVSEPCYTVSKYCIPEKCLEDIKIRDRVSSLSDTVYAACIDDDCRYAVKMFPINPKDLDADKKMTELENEIQMSQLASDSGYGPVVKRVIRDCKVKMGRGNILISLLVMERFDTSLYDLLQARPELKSDPFFTTSLKAKLMEAVEGVAKASIYHADLHAGNILFNLKDGQIARLVIGDYGRSSMSSPGVALVAMREALRDSESLNFLFS